VSIQKRVGKRGTSYQVKYRDTNGKQIAKTFKTKKEATLFKALQHNEKQKHRVSSLGDYSNYGPMARMYEPEKKFKHAGQITPFDRPRPAYLQWQTNHERWSENASLLGGSEGLSALWDWQEYRCAMCGFEDAKIVKDHCHESGLIRGLLCQSCNLNESSNDSLCWQIYRKFPLAMLVNVKVFYNDFSSWGPKECVFSKEGIDTPWWESEKELSYQVLNDFCKQKVSLNWMEREQFSKLIKTAMEFVKEGL
jgi:hypothetical protein